jgi:TRAP-type C4-dicarboxylate transport system permease small subunit
MAVALVKQFERFVNLLVAVVRVFCILMTIALFAVVVLAIIFRYGFGQAVSWTEEVPRYMLIWISFLTAAVGILYRDHVGFDVLFNAMPRPVRRVLGLVLTGLIFIFGWVVFWYGIVFVQDFGGDLMETISYPNYWYYPAMPVSGFLMMVFALKLAVDELTKSEVSSLTGTTVD